MVFGYKPELYPIKVVSEKSAILAAAIRNECLEFMTRDPKRLTIEDQIRWLNSKPVTTQLFIYQKNNTPYPIGYGLIRLEGHNWWLSGGLAEGWRGKGLGKEIFTHLMSLRDETWLEVLASNERAVKLYTSLGFVEKERRECSPRGCPETAIVMRRGA